MSSAITSAKMVRPARDFVLMEKIVRYVQIGTTEMAATSVVEGKHGIIGVSPAAERYNDRPLSSREPGQYRLHAVGPKAEAEGWRPGMVVLLDHHYSRATLALVDGREMALQPCEGIVCEVVLPPEVVVVTQGEDDAAAEIARALKAAEDAAGN